MKILNSISMALLMLTINCSCTSTINKPKAIDTQKMLDYCVEKVQKTANSLYRFDSLPRNINSLQSQWNKVGIYDWTTGFWPGILWNAFEVSGDAKLLASAKGFTESLKGVLSVPVDNHDLGFMFYCSYGNGYRITKDTTYRNILIKAADSLATLFNPKVGTILSWPVMCKKMNWPHNTIIDNLINLELLFWASKNGGKKEYYNMAVKHAETCQTTLIRPDYTTYHVGVFDIVDGHFIKGVTHQGYADNSMWARGQAWAIYGYTLCFRETGKSEFLETAQKLADVFVARLPKDGIPFWDFDDPAIPNAPKDASAAAVAASGMLELCGLVSDKAAKEKYKTTAIALLTKLSSPEYFSGDVNQAFLLHSTGHKPNGSEIDASIIYADYYYLEALMRLDKIEKKEHAN
jgi:unsaturated chondroitin disaccharide hydrolase